MALFEERSSAKGEVSGAFLLGLFQSFDSFKLKLPSKSDLWLEAIDPTGWYPYAQLMDLIHEIRREVPKAGAIFFQAGVHFIRLWYKFGPGKTMVHSGRDWLYANQDSGGYNTVVRGGPRQEIGWCVIQHIDEKAGIVVYENVTPLSPDYVRGVFYGGCYLFDDMDFVDVSAEAEEYPPNPNFTRTMITVRFHLKPNADLLDLDGAVAAAAIRGEEISLAPMDVQRLIWRYKSSMVRHQLDAEYFDEVIGLLQSSNSKSLRLAGELQQKVEELQLALRQVQTMETLLPICAWCKRLRTEDSRWLTLEEISKTRGSFTHGICPDCVRKLE